MSMSSLTEPDLFLSEFEKRVAQIRASILSAEKAADIDAVCSGLNDLHDFLAEGAYVLPAYDVRRANETLAELGAARQDKGERLMPRQPFRFRHRRALKEEYSPDNTTFSISPRKNALEQSTLVVEREGSGADALNAASLQTSRAVEIRNRNGDSNIQLPTGSFRDRDISLARLRACTVYLCDVASAVRGVDLRDCQLYIGAVAGSVHLTDCVGCEIHCAARQVRIHTSRYCTFRLRTVTGPIIEESSHLEFGPYCLTYRGSDLHLAEAELPDSSGTAWMNVQDFSWLREGSSPNWSLVATKVDDPIALDDVINFETSTCKPRPLQ